MYIDIFSYLVRNDTAKISQQKNRNSVFAVHITGLEPIYAFRAIPFT